MSPSGVGRTGCPEGGLNDEFRHQAGKASGVNAPGPTVIRCGFAVARVCTSFTEICSNIQPSSISTSGSSFTSIVSRIP